ncbi:MarR family winged helix-turn-helix transcriptional regulator [Nocardia sp. NPDC051981]|uniref:MarR family winged helix-turn-helix transcriptional regulator n=1 Tax=Nocardia sp. NPDC051981 TaxID=3155417 RepID=UPI00344548D3
MVNAGDDNEVADKVVAALDRIARGVRAHRQAIASRTGLTPLQLELLRTLADGPPPEPLTGLLAAELGVSQPTVSDSLLALERKGHVARQPAPGDRRRSAIVLTSDGAELAAEIRAADDVLRACVADLPGAQQDQTLRTLLDLIAGLLRAGVVQVARTCTTCRFYRPGDAGTPRCDLLQQPLPPRDLRVNCPEHQPAGD